MTDTPSAVWNSMVEGNERFIAGTPEHPRQDVERRIDLIDAQQPRAAIFGCSDSRLAAEIIFDLGLGDAFVVRNAGQVISVSVLGSLEYAVSVLKVPLILVLGHDQCGAVRAAIDSVAPDAVPLPVHIETLIAPIIPAVQRIANASGGRLPVSTSADDVSEVGREHLRDTVAELIEGSELISAAVADGTLGLVGANYRLDQGRVVPDVLVGML